MESLEELETKDIVFTLAKTPSNSRLEIVHSTFPETDHASRKRMEEFIEMTQAYSGDLPPMRILFSSYDNPSMHTDWSIKHLALEAAKSGTSALFIKTEMSNPTHWILMQQFPEVSYHLFLKQVGYRPVPLIPQHGPILPLSHHSINLL